jgi:predicted TIM-barrel fold metal-dependent hydrolase
MEFFDSDILIGRAIDQDEDAAPTAADVVAELDRNGVARALVTHTKILLSNVDWGNNDLHAQLKKHPRLRPIFGTWGIVDRAGYDPIDVAIDKAIKRGGAGIQMWCKETALGFAAWQFPELLGALCERQLPLFMHSDQADWNSIDDVLTKFPRLKLVLQRVIYGDSRRLLALMKLHPGLHLSASPGFVGGSVFEQFDRYVGVDRILFGSGLFKYDQIPAVAQITYSTLSDEKKSLIAGGNLTRLLEAIR